MTVVITMAGAGSRFRNWGDDVPKHMIRARGHTLFEWSMRTLEKFFDHHFIFACSCDHDTHWIKYQAAHLGVKNVSIAPRRSISFGQAETAFDVMHLADSHEPVWIFNIDTYIKHGVSPLDISGYQGCAHVFESRNSSMSFVKYDDDGEVIDFAEKIPISNWATVGLYGFESADLYHRFYTEAYLDGRVEEVGGERYIAPIYKLLLKAGKSVCAPKLELAAVNILGTPTEVLRFDPLAGPSKGL